MRLLIIVSLLLSGCSLIEKGTVIRDRVQTANVAVSAPCVLGERPEEIKPISERFTQEQWDALTTDQREKLIVAQGLKRKAYGDELHVATSACP